MTRHEHIEQVRQACHAHVDNRDFRKAIGTLIDRLKSYPETQNHPNLTLYERLMETEGELANWKQVRNLIDGAQ